MCAFPVVTGKTLPYPIKMLLTQRGLLIVFEGIDGAGKTTQVDLLEKFFVSIAVPTVRSKEPTDGAWGKKIRDSATNGRMPLEEELHAFTEDRKEHVRDLISPALADGKIVILDRYFYSTVAYQGMNGANADTIASSMIEQFPIPDVVFLIDVPVDLGISRVRNGRGETPNGFEQNAGLESARQIFLGLAKKHSPVRVVDGTATIEMVRSNVLRLLLDDKLKAKFCAKVYGCDDPFNCGPRLSGECQWFNMCRAASQFVAAL